MHKYDDYLPTELTDRLGKMAESNERLNISLTNDFAFKTIFHNVKALTGLLSAALEIPAEEIETLIFPETILTGEYLEDKEGILDVKIIMNNHKKVNVELQIRKFPFWEERSLFYNCRMFTENFERGMDYSKLETCIQISILNFDLHEGNELFSKVGLVDLESGHVYSDKFSFRVLYLNHIDDASEAEKQTDIYKWARMISTTDPLELENIAAGNEYMKEAYKEMERINSDKALRYRYLKEEMEESDRATIRYGGYLEGEARSEARLTQLNLKLLAEKNYAELEAASKDKNYRDALLKKYGL
ncbi:MAG: Rpn family recombination-promoting nuclease/putative transposase [Clostridium sp.]